MYLRLRYHLKWYYILKVYSQKWVVGKTVLTLDLFILEICSIASWPTHHWIYHSCHLSTVGRVSHDSFNVKLIFICIGCDLSILTNSEGNFSDGFIRKKVLLSVGRKLNRFGDMLKYLTAEGAHFQQFLWYTYLIQNIHLIIICTLYFFSTPCIS